MDEKRRYKNTRDEHGKMQYKRLRNKVISEFCYLGSKIAKDGRCDADIRYGIGQAKIALVKILQLLVVNINLEIRKKLLKIYVWSVALHGYKLLKIHSVKKVPGIDHSKSPVKDIVKNLFDAKFAPLSSILTWSSSTFCHLVYPQCIHSVNLKNNRTLYLNHTTCSAIY